MGTSFGKSPIIDDDGIADILAPLMPSTSKVTKLAQKARGISPEYKWKGLVLLYECYRRFDWIPDRDLLEKEYQIAMDSNFSDWTRPIEAKSRITEMYNQMSKFATTKSR